MTYYEGNSQQLLLYNENSYEIGRFTDEYFTLTAKLIISTNQKERFGNYYIALYNIITPDGQIVYQSTEKEDLFYAGDEFFMLQRGVYICIITSENEWIYCSEAISD